MSLHFRSSSLSAVWHWRNRYKRQRYGAVADPSGAVMPNLTVELRSPVTGYSQTAVTDGAGVYHFSNVPQSTYAVEVSAQGFAPPEANRQRRYFGARSRQFLARDERRTNGSRSHGFRRSDRRRVHRPHRRGFLTY